MHKSLITALATTSILALAGTAPAMAQVAGQEAQPPAGQQQSAPQVNVDDSQLALFHKVSTKLGEIRQETQMEMSSAESTEAAQQLQQEATTKMRSAIESMGMTVDEYNQIASAVQADPDLRSRLSQMQ